MTGLKLVIEIEDSNEEVVATKWTNEGTERDKNLYSDDIEDVILSSLFEHIKIFIISKKIPTSSIRSLNFIEI